MKGTDLPPPNLEFHDDVFPDYVMTEVKRQGFKKPTPIQAQSWPIALSGRDLVGIARTGSGKTLGKFEFIIFWFAYSSEDLLFELFYVSLRYNIHMHLVAVHRSAVLNIDL